MSDDLRPVLLVLDTSAVLAYTRGSIHVGEPMAEVDADGGVVGLPVVCLAEASWMVNSVNLLALLAGHNATRLLGLGADWSGLADCVDVTGRVDCASAVLAAASARCQILTAQPGPYGGMAGGGPVIPLPR